MRVSHQESDPLAIVSFQMMAALLNILNATIWETLNQVIQLSSSSQILI